MTEHKAEAKYLGRNAGWVAWMAVCSCGYREKPRPGFTTVHDLVEEHNDQHGPNQGGDLLLQCECWDPRTLEFKDRHPCDYCKRLDAEGLA